MGRIDGEEWSEASRNEEGPYAIRSFWVLNERVRYWIPLSLHPSKESRYDLSLNEHSQNVCNGKYSPHSMLIPAIYLSLTQSRIHRYCVEIHNSSFYIRSHVIKSIQWSANDTTIAMPHSTLHFLSSNLPVLRKQYITTFKTTLIGMIYTSFHLILHTASRNILFIPITSPTLIHWFKSVGYPSTKQDRDDSVWKVILRGEGDEGMEREGDHLWLKWMCDTKRIDMHHSVISWRSSEELRCLVMREWWDRYLQRLWYRLWIGRRLEG